MQSIFGTDGIRGRFNKEITYPLAFKVGYALGVTLDNNNPILIGRDTRISGDILLHAIAKGITASGKEFNKSDQVFDILNLNIEYCFCYSC